MKPRHVPPYILFFDGHCGLCHRMVQMFLRCDRHDRFRFAPLQGITAEELLRTYPVPQTNGETVILLDERGIHLRSEAVIRAVAHLGGVWSLSRMFLIFPRRIRDGMYDFLASRRYAWFGDASTCLNWKEHHRILP